MRNLGYRGYQGRAERVRPKRPTPVVRWGERRAGVLERSCKYLRDRSQHKMANSGNVANS